MSLEAYPAVWEWSRPGGSARLSSWPWLTMPAMTAAPQKKMVA